MPEQKNVLIEGALAEGSSCWIGFTWNGIHA